MAATANNRARFGGVARFGRCVLIGPALLLSWLPLTACRATMPHATTQPTVPTGNAALVEHISERAYVTAEAAYRSAYVLWKGETFEGEFSELTAALQDGGIISGGWNLAADQYVDRATIGFMVCRACGIRSGLNWRLTGLGRYAWRELQYKQIAGEGSEMNLIGGGEYLGLLTRAEDYMRTTDKRAIERAELGAEP